MADDAFALLERQLRGAPPEGLRTLDDGSLRDLSDAVAAARRRQAAELNAAGDKAFKLVPRLLRVPIRKVLG